MPPKVPPIVVTGPEPWKGVDSLPRVRELEEAGLKRMAIARIFGVSLETLRNAEKRELPKKKLKPSSEELGEFRAFLERFRSRGVRGVRLPDEALSRDSIYEGRG